MATSPNALPAAEATPPVCGWTIGFRRGGHCMRPTEDDSPLCVSHQVVEKKISARAEQTAGRAQRALIRRPGSLGALRDVGNSRALAEGWWITDGVRVIPPTVYRSVLNSGPCAYCGDPKVREVDHIVPVVQGGLSERDNLAPACETCNQEKSDLTPEEWRQKRSEQGLSWPPDPYVAQVFKAVEAMMDGEPPPFLTDLAYEPLTDNEERPAGYRQDPRWLAAQEILCEERSDLADDEIQIFRAVAAAHLMYKIETEYEPSDPRLFREAVATLGRARDRS